MKLKILIVILGIAMVISGIALAWFGTHGAAGRLTNNTTANEWIFEKPAKSPNGQDIPYRSK